MPGGRLAGAPEVVMSEQPDNFRFWTHRGYQCVTSEEEMGFRALFWRMGTMGAAGFKIHADEEQANIAARAQIDSCLGVDAPPEGAS